MQQHTEVYVGPDQTGKLDLKTATEVLRKHRLKFNFKEQAWMQWGEDPELGLIFQVEDSESRLQRALNELRDVLGTERISVFYPGDLDD